MVSQSVSDCRQRAGGEQKRIARQEGKDHEPCFAENDHEKDHVGPDPETLDDDVQVFVDMENYIDELQQYFQRIIL